MKCFHTGALDGKRHWFGIIKADGVGGVGGGNTLVWEAETASAKRFVGDTAPTCPDDFQPMPFGA